MDAALLQPYQYKDLPLPTSFRFVELLPGQPNEPISCILHVADWSALPEYEAISYAWGDPNARATVICDGKRIEVTRNLYNGLTHIRYPDRSRFLFADALWYVFETSPSANL